jgi:hypothetical protein
MSELAFGASYNNLWTNESYRGLSNGLIESSHGSMRDKAWTLRNLAEAAWLLPDSYPLVDEFDKVVQNSLDDWNAKYTNNPGANPLGVTDDSTVYSLNGGNLNAVAPWQHNFLTWSAGHAAELGFSGAAEFRNWLAKFEIGLMTDWQSHSGRGYCWLQASTYSIQVKDASGHWLPSYTAVYQATFPALVGLSCNSPAMVDAMGKLEKRPWHAGEMHGYPYAAEGFPANFQIGIAAAADSGLPNAQAAWNLFDSRSVKPSGNTAYNNDPNFAVVPRSVSSGSLDPAPITNPIPPTAPAPTPPTPAKAAPPAVPAPPGSAVIPPLPAPPAQPTIPQTSPASAWRRPVPASVVKRALDVMDGAFSYFEILPRLLPYAVVEAMQTPLPPGTANLQRPPESAHLPQLPDAASSAVQHASATPTAQSAKVPVALATQPVNIVLALPARQANGSSLQQRTLETDCRTSAGRHTTKLECTRQQDLL